jgi:hypothetical protein
MSIELRISPENISEDSPRDHANLDSDGLLNCLAGWVSWCDSARSNIIEFEAPLIRFLEDTIACIEQVHIDNSFVITDLYGTFSLEFSLNDGDVSIKEVDSEAIVLMTFSEFIDDASILSQLVFSDLPRHYPRLEKNERYLQLRASCLDRLSTIQGRYKDVP